MVSGEDVPPFDNSAVDGYAVRAVDLVDAPTELAVVGETAAGAAAGRSIGAGEAIRIMTGAPMPPGATAVAMVEDSTMVGPDRVRLAVAVSEGVAVRRVGDDVRIGDVLFRAGTRRATRGRRCARQRQRDDGVGVSRGRWSRCCRPATSWSTTVRRCNRDRSARATGRCSPRCSTRPAATSSTSASSATTRTNSRRRCARPPLAVTPSSRAVGCRWATTTW